MQLHEAGISTLVLLSGQTQRTGLLLIRAGSPAPGDPPELKHKFLDQHSIVLYIFAFRPCCLI